MRLPSLAHDFNHARVEQVVLGPRREITLSVSPLRWTGQRGEYAEAVTVRFGGIRNFAKVSAFLTAVPHAQSELAWLGYAEEQPSKPGRLFFDLIFERTDARLRVQCSSLQVDVPRQ